jgi:hypothetical protein
MNKHLNYFHAYSNDHEDQLTRGLLCLLKLSPTLFAQVYDHVKSKYDELEMNLELYSMPRYSDANLSTYSSDIQVSGATEVKASYALSVLITDKTLPEQKKVNKGKRGARYDGVVTIAEELIIFIENKPRKENVWDEQLSPNLEETHPCVLLPSPVILQWKDIITILVGVKRNGLLSTTEAALVDDFCDFIDENFPYLNPYSTFELCKNNPELINRHLHLLLDKLASRYNETNGNSEYNTSRHSGWGAEILLLGEQTKEKGISMIGFPIELTELGAWDMTVSMQFGVSQRQSKAIFERSITNEQVETLKAMGWNVNVFIWLGFMQGNRQRIEPKSGKNVERAFIQHWHMNKHLIKQRQIASASDFALINELNENGLVNDLELAKNVYTDKFLRHEKIRKVNISPTIEFEKTFSKETLIIAERGKNIEGLLEAGINDVLQTILGKSL